MFMLIYVFRYFLIVYLIPAFVPAIVSLLLCDLIKYDMKPHCQHRTLVEQHSCIMKVRMYTNPSFISNVVFASCFLWQQYLSLKLLTILQISHSYVLLEQCY